MGFTDSVTFKLGGHKYRIGLQDGYVMDPLDLPEGLRSCPRFNNFLARKQQEVREIRCFLDSEMREASASWKKFNYTGRKYSIRLDAWGDVLSVRLPSGKEVANLPPELASSPRFKRFLARNKRGC